MSEKIQDTKQESRTCGLIFANYSLKDGLSKEMRIMRLCDNLLDYTLQKALRHSSAATSAGSSALLSCLKTSCLLASLLAALSISRLSLAFSSHSGAFALSGAFFSFLLFLLPPGLQGRFWPGTMKVARNSSLSASSSLS